MSLLRPTLGVAIAYALVVAAITRRPLALLQLVAQDLLLLGPLALGVGAVLLLARCWQRRGEGAAARPSEVLADLVRRRSAHRCLEATLVATVSVSLTLGGYNLFKQLVLPDTRYWLGMPIANLDRLLFGGHDAWRVSHALLPHAWETRLLDLLYHGWFVPMGVGVALCGFARQGCRIAGRYLSSYVATWIVQGTVMAWLFPAAGPCFVKPLKHLDRFVPMTDRLAMQDAWLVRAGLGGLSSVHYQAMLLRGFRSDQPILGGGIAAMPSLHNALAVLFACAAFQLHRGLGIVFAVYAVLIWIGSIHLGWHYGLDGAVAATCALLTWAACGRLQEVRWPTSRLSPALVPA